MYAYVGILFYAYFKGMLTTFITNAIAIISCAIEFAFANWFFKGIAIGSDLIEAWIKKPIRECIEKIPHPIKALWRIALGIGILYLDERFAAKIFAEDEAQFISIMFQGKKYWFTLFSIGVGGFYILYGALPLLYIPIRLLLSFLDRRTRFTLIIRR